MFASLPVARQKAIIDKLVDAVVKDRWYRLNLVLGFFHGCPMSLKYTRFNTRELVHPIVSFPQNIIDLKNEWTFINLRTHHAIREITLDSIYFEGGYVKEISSMFTRDLFIEILCGYLVALDVNLVKIREIFKDNPEVSNIANTSWMALQFNGVKTLKGRVTGFLARKIKEGKGNEIVITYLPSPQIVADLWIAVKARLTSKDSPKERAKFYLELGIELLSVYWQSEGLKDSAASSAASAASLVTSFPYGAMFQQALGVPTRSHRATTSFEGMWQYAEKMSEKKYNYSIDSCLIKIYHVPRGPARIDFVREEQKFREINGCSRLTSKPPPKKAAAKAKAVPTVSLAKALCAK